MSNLRHFKRGKSHVKTLKSKQQASEHPGPLWRSKEQTVEGSSTVNLNSRLGVYRSRWYERQVSRSPLPVLQRRSARREVRSDYERDDHRGSRVLTSWRVVISAEIFDQEREST